MINCTIKVKHCSSYLQCNGLAVKTLIGIINSFWILTIGQNKINNLCTKGGDIRTNERSQFFSSNIYRFYTITKVWGKHPFTLWICLPKDAMEWDNRRVAVNVLRREKDKSNNIPFQNFIFDIFPVKYNIVYLS